MDKRMIAVLMTVLLDGMGIGLTLPILPDLLRSVGHSDDLGWHFGAFFGLYALMQFLASPLLGLLSDRFGRRPVLMLSLAGAAIDYLFMAFAPTLMLLFIGRAISGVTAASMAVATAYVADISTEDRRARHFGQLSAAVGLGYIVGPVVGGVLGQYWLRAPFLAAAILNAVNLIVTFLVLRESHTGGRNSGVLSLNPLMAMRWALGFQGLAGLIGTFLIIGVVGQIGGTLWVLYGQDRFGWDLVTVGVSLACYGLLHALAQAFLAGPLSERWGERRTILIGIAADSVAYAGIAFAAQGWIAFALLPFFCAGSIATPAIQSLLSSKVDEAHQGRLQGVLASFGGLVAALCPLFISAGYFATREIEPNVIWLTGAALYLLCLPALRREKHRASTAQTPERRLPSSVVGGEPPMS